MTSLPKSGSEENALTITVENLGKRFSREWIFRKLSHTFFSGQTYAIVGPNGSGKSTLLQILWGQMLPSSGNVNYEFNGAALEPESVFKRVSIATPYMDLIEEFTLAELLNFHFGLKKSRDNMTVEDMLVRMQLDYAKNRHLANFSSGMRQRVKLALALFTDADAIFLDEPGTNLDQQSFEWYQSNLERLPKSSLIFIASNQPAEYPSNAQKIDITSYK